MKNLLLILISLLVFVPTVFAASPPSLQGPANDSTTSDTSPRLSWTNSEACSTEGSCYLVEVDETDSFADPQRSTYTNNLNYSPNLSTGKWYWRVKAKALANNWSEFSQTWSFTIGENTQPSPQPTSQPSNNPSPEPSPDNNSPFTVTSVPSDVDSDSSFKALVQLSGLSPNATYYIKGAFYKEGSTNYFGKTLVSGDWVKNSASAISQFKFSASNSGNWAGSLEVSPDSSDSGFTGSGGYQFRVARYNSSGSDLTWSNNLPIHINYIPEPTPEPTSNPEKSPSPSKTAKPTSQPTSASKTASSTKKSSILGSGSNFPGIASVAGIASTSSSIDDNPVLENSFIESESYINWWLIGGGVLALLGSSYPLIKKNVYFAKPLRKFSKFKPQLLKIKKLAVSKGLLVGD